MIKILKKPIVIILIIVIIGGLLGYNVFYKKPTAPYEFVVAKRSNLVQKVSVSGRIKPAESVDLAFEKSGKVSRVYVTVNDKVKIGQLLVSLDNTDLLAQLSQAKAGVESAKAQLQQYQAALDAQQAKLDELKKGARQEDIQIKETELKKAQQDLDNYYNSVANILNDAYNKADDAINKQIDELFSDDYSDNPQLTFFVANSQAEIDAESQRIVVGNELKQFKSEISDLPTTHSGLDNVLIQAENHLVVIRNFLTRLADAVNSAVGISQTTLSTYKSYINTARANINTAISNINTQKEYIATQKVTVEKHQNELALKKAGTIQEQITAQEAQVKQAQANIISQESQVKYAEANVQNIQAQIQKTIIYSPINGIITKQNAKVGEIISANTTLISIISENEFEIEVYIPEADIAKVKVGNSAKVTLDAYGDDIIFKAKVIAIDPAETVIEGVIYYKAIMIFDDLDDRIKAGMTIDADIITAERKDSIAIPQRAILKKEGERIVRVLKNGTIEEVKVETGITDTEGQIEIISGLEEGDRVITFVKIR